MVRARGTLLLAYQYTGYQVVQAFVYLATALMLLERERADRALTFFRSLIPDKEEEAFDICFQPVLDQWKAKNFGCFLQQVQEVEENVY